MFREITDTMCFVLFVDSFHRLVDEEVWKQMVNLIMTVFTDSSLT